MTNEDPAQNPQSPQADQSGQAGDAAVPPPGQVLEIRKYPNRRLYDATRSRHVTLDELYELVAAGHTVQVRDSRSGEDLTNQILLQALIERDPTKVTAVPTPLIHLMIRMNAHLIASWFDLGLRQMVETYRAAAAGGAPPGASGGPAAPWWPAGWPTAPGMTWPSAWPTPGTPPREAAAPVSPFAWMEPFLRGAGGTEEAESTPEEDDDLEALHERVAALAAELERLRSSRKRDKEDG
jgi:polyhydroxyalkanoate synthesis repressor PhaR